MSMWSVPMGTGIVCHVSYVGAWELPGGDNITCVRFMTTRKPRWIHRVFMRLLLGWKWVPDAK